MLNYKVAGQGPVVLFIHGFCEDLSIWHKAHSYLETYTVLCIDLPGFGASAFIKNQDLSTMAKEIDTLLRQLEVEKVTIIGHSLGGYVGLKFSQLYPEKVSGLGLFHSTIFGDSEEKKENRNKTIAFIEKHGVGNFANSFIGTLFHPDNRAKFEPEIKALSEIVKSTSKEAIIETTKAMRDREDFSPFVAKIQTPMLYIVGKEDQAVPLQKSLEQCHIAPDNSILILEKTAHMGMYENKQKTYTTIKHFADYCKS